jgi:acetylornithine deacetylase/succinyl-diaminopimelate desuccinylase-like protein
LTPPRERVAAFMPEIRAGLERLVRIPSVSAPGHDAEAVRRSAHAVADEFLSAGMKTHVLEIEGAHPAVLGTLEAPDGAPTVLLYAHHDVQPTGPIHLWSSDPFEPVERDGRLFGRGTADDKAGVMAHVAAVRAWEGRPPVGVVTFIEGEEEAGSEHLGAFLDRYGDQLSADAVVLADSTNWRVGQPALTTSLRGLVDCVIEVRTLDHAVHSGMFGGPIPDAITALARILAALHDDAGRVAIPGLVCGTSDPLDLEEAELRRDAGVRPSVRLLGEGPLTERLWTRPAVTVLGIDAPSIESSINQIVPSARARVSLRLAPGEDTGRAMRSLVQHLEASAPWGAEVTVTPGGEGPPYAVQADRPAHAAMRRAFAEAWGRESLDIGTGGSIPFLAAFAAAYPEAALLLTGVEDPGTNAHSENESLHLGDFERACVAEALFLGYLAETG